MMDRRRIILARNVQIVALVLALAAVALCCIVIMKPEWVGINTLGNNRAIPVAAVVGSAGFVVVDIFFLVTMTRARSLTITKTVVIISALLLCFVAVVVEPVTYVWESRQLQIQGLQVRDAAKIIALISAKQGVREEVRMILFISAACSFFSMGSFWMTAPDLDDLLADLH